MSFARKLEADSARLRLLEDAVREELAHVRGRLAGLRVAEAALVAASAMSASGQDAQQLEAKPASATAESGDAQTPSPSLSQGNAE